MTVVQPRALALLILISVVEMASDSVVRLCNAFEAASLYQTVAAFTGNANTRMTPLVTIKYTY